ncbi:MAG: sulfurtransferase TusA family protein [Geminicoccaceae bacterium]
MKKSQYSLDITTDVCPITMVKTKLLLEDMPVGEIATIRLNSGEPLDNVPRTLRDQGHEVLELEPEATGSAVHRLVVKKGPDRF